MAKRKSTIGVSPFARFLQPDEERQEQPEPMEPQKPAKQPEPVERVEHTKQMEPTEHQKPPGYPPTAISSTSSPSERSTGGASARKLSTELPEDLQERLRNAVYWSRGLTLQGVIRSAIAAEVERLEKENGGPFPPRSGSLPPGRPMK